MIKTIFLLRHATAEEPANSTMVKDFDRELISKGIMETARLGKYLADEKISLDAIYCSPSARTLQTANLVAEQLKINQEQIIQDENLYGGGPRGYLSLINGLMESEKSVCIVGHNPDITFFAEYLTRDDIGGEMKKCTLVQLSFEDLKWNEISQKAGKVVNRIDIKTLSENE